jgi:hypothetical protein
MCDHEFVYGGVKYENHTNALPGTGACRRDYFDWFYCKKCLENKYIELSYFDNTYTKIAFDATPK